MASSKRKEALTAIKARYERLLSALDAVCDSGLSLERESARRWVPSPPRFVVLAMNIARHVAGSALRFRTYATAAYVPPASLEALQRGRAPPPKPKPESPTFYTGRANYYDQLLALESATNHTRSALQELQLLPLPRFVRENLPPLYGVWKNKVDLSELMTAKLTTSRYRRFLAQLNQLNEYRRLAELAGHVELAERIQRVLDVFERDNKDAILARGRRKPVKFDEFGRSYTIGRRKESTARCWVIPAQPSPEDVSASASPADAPSPEPPVTSELLSSAAALDPGVQGFVNPAPPVKVSTTNILVNNTPLAEYL